MNEIEKMYKNAGIEPTVRNKAVGRGYYIEHLREEVYPPFTAEKQLKLIDWFIKNEDNVRINYDEIDRLYYIQTNLKETISSENFAEALANLINIYFKDFIEEEKEDIKELLDE